VTTKRKRTLLVKPPVRAAYGRVVLQTASFSNPAPRGELENAFVETNNWWYVNGVEGFVAPFVAGASLT
jgi:hypothetical protein